MGGRWKNRIKKEKQEQRSNHFAGFLKNIRTWHLVLILIPILFLTATFLRFDNLKMAELKDAVMAADAAGEDEEGNLKPGETQRTQEEINAELEKALKELKDFVSTHTVMNFIETNGKVSLVFGTGPFYLEHQYNRLAAAAIAEAQQIASQITDSNPNGNVYAAASAVCQPQAIRKGWHWNTPAYINCMTGEIAKYPVSDYITEQITANIPSTALFRHDFASPAWTPTLSGIFMLLSAIFILVIVVRITTWILLHIALIFIK